MCGRFGRIVMSVSRSSLKPNSGNRVTLDVRVALSGAIWALLEAAASGSSVGKFKRPAPLQQRNNVRKDEDEYSLPVQCASDDK